MTVTSLSVVICLVILSICCIEISAEKPDLSDLAEKPEEVEEIPLVKIEKEIQQELDSPTAPDVSFEIQLKILKNIVNYENRLIDLYAGVQNNTYKKLQLARDLAKQEGPTFLKKEINEDKLVKVYNWDDESLDFFRDSVKVIREVWNNITIALKDRPSPMEIFMSDKKKY